MFSIPYPFQICLSPVLGEQWKPFIVCCYVVVAYYYSLLTSLSHRDIRCMPLIPNVNTGGATCMLRWIKGLRVSHRSDKDAREVRQGAKK